MRIKWAIADLLITDSMVADVLITGSTLTTSIRTGSVMTVPVIAGSTPACFTVSPMSSQPHVLAGLSRLSAATDNLGMKKAPRGGGIQLGFHPMMVWRY